jgi:putative transcriptional regulator
VETTIAPGLLVSMPHLLDPHFTRAVVLMIEHSQEGSFGLVINQPSNIGVAELLRELDIKWRGPEDDVVWSGGPVTPSTGWVLHEPLDSLAGLGVEVDGATLAVAPGIALSTSPDLLRDIAETPPARVRFLLGYAGWGPGQLASEMVRGSWLHAEASAELVFETPADEMWDTALRSIGVNPEAIIQSQGVH